MAAWVQPNPELALALERGQRILFGLSGACVLSMVPVQSGLQSSSPSTQILPTERCIVMRLSLSIAEKNFTVLTVSTNRETQ